ncbi:hypothetical protein QVD17_01850 [Tagetes erecta]|uniref:NAC domain-containing protein n=1 Tax=Tagetes erecta TaxID=13708 RepID=A0AAD8LEE7_TARER|nr:hypothetical protein QVD17_01850 [Tagetes erecta]
MTRTSLIPGFRFHPTDVELVMFYLKRKLLGKKIKVNAVAEVNIYDYSPWDLPDKSSLKSGDLEWYFFCPKSKKYSNGSRSNRATEKGFWKATGKDRIVKYNERNVATIKTLVFHLGHAGKGKRTDWVMHEYKMEDEHLANAGVVQDMYVLLKIFEKSGSGPKTGAQYGAPFIEEEWDEDLASCIDSQVSVGLVGASNPMDNKQKGPATMELTEPGSSTVTFSANNEAPAPSTMILPQCTPGPSVTEPGPSGVTFVNKMQLDLPTSDDVMFLEDVNLIMGLEEVEDASVDKMKGMGANEDDGIYGGLVNLVNLDELIDTSSKTDGADYTDDGLFSLDDLDLHLEDFYAD